MRPCSLSRLMGAGVRGLRDRFASEMSYCISDNIHWASVPAKACVRYNEQHGPVPALGDLTAQRQIVAYLCCCKEEF